MGSLGLLGSPTGLRLGACPLWDAQVQSLCDLPRELQTLQSCAQLQKSNKRPGAGFGRAAWRRKPEECGATVREDTSGARNGDDRLPRAGPTPAALQTGLLNGEAASHDRQGEGPVKKKLAPMQHKAHMLMSNKVDSGSWQGPGPPPWLPSPPSWPRPRAVHNASALAYLGDSIYELYARRHFLTPPQNLDKYTSSVTAVVCCEAQDFLVRELCKTSFLTAEERDILRWGRNVSPGNRRARGRAGSAVYISASSLETLVGYLYLTDTARLEALMVHLGFLTGGAAAPEHLEGSTSVGHTLAQHSLSGGHPGEQRQLSDQDKLNI